MSDCGRENKEEGVAKRCVSGCMRDCHEYVGGYVTVRYHYDEIRCVIMNTCPFEDIAPVASVLPLKNCRTGLWSHTGLFLNRTGSK